MNQVTYFSVSLLIICSAVTGRSISNTASITYYNSDFRHNGYRFSYETSDGMYREEEGYFRNSEMGDMTWEVKGKVSWIDDNGYRQTQKFIANEHGYQIRNTTIQSMNEKSPPTIQELSGPIMSPRGGLIGKR